MGTFDQVAEKATRDLVIDLVESLDEGENSIAILGRENQIYIETISG